MFDCEIRNAPPRIQLIGRWKGLRWANIKAGRATSAMADFWAVWFKKNRSENRTQEKEIAQIPRQEIGMFALPSQTCSLRKGFLHHWGRIDKNLNLMAFACLIQQPSPEALEPLFDAIMIVFVLSIDRDRSA